MLLCPCWTSIETLLVFLLNLNDGDLFVDGNQRLSELLTLQFLFDDSETDTEYLQAFQSCDGRDGDVPRKVGG